MTDYKEFTVRVEESPDGGYVASPLEMPGYTAEGETGPEARAELIAALGHLAEARGWDMHVIKPVGLKWNWTIQSGSDKPTSFGNEPEVGQDLADAVRTLFLERQRIGEVFIGKKVVLPQQFAQKLALDCDLRRHR